MRGHRVAVIGMGCRFAGAKNPEELWKLMMTGKAHSSPMGKRFADFETYYHPDSRAEGKFYNKRAFFLDNDMDLFDADFFHISYKEAKRMDYQQRMLLEVSYEALQDAGIEIRGTDAGIFIGAFMQDFLTNTMQENNYDNLSSQHATGSSIGMLANRLSYFYDVHGPSMAVDTACSSSLTALYLAMESIKSGKCDVALCGGVNIMTEVGNFIILSKGSFLSTESRSAAFGAGADGYARGEGVGVLVLKEWNQAVEDKDNILCEIVQIQINHDGNKKGITYPNGQAQAALLRQIYENSGISVNDIGYVEAHGTGTRVGDQVETEALYQVFGERKKPLYVGSLKTNIGHTEAAAGCASVIKGILMLQHGVIPPSLHCQEKNPNIPFQEYRIVPVKREKTLEAASDGRFYIGINAFGFGGANAHVVIGNGSVGRIHSRQEDMDIPHTLFLEANSTYSLKLLTKQYRYEMQCGALKDYSLGEICNTIAQRRPHNLPCRLAVTAKDVAQMVKQLVKFEKDENDQQQMCKCSNKKYNKLIAVFSGMGIQTEDMGRNLYLNYPVFREYFHKCSRAYEENSGRSLEEVIRQEQVPKDFFRVGFLQSYNLAYQISLFKLLQFMGLKFEGCVGHSAGELAAFYCSGMLTLAETFRVAWIRGSCQELMQGKGKMLALKMDRKQATEICEKWENKISLAVENGETGIVLSGDYELLREIQSKWDGSFLEGTIAYHSLQMEEIKQEFCERLGESVAQEPQISLYSTVYGRKMKREDYDSSYWWRNVRDTVEFHSTLQELKRDGADAFAEIGTTPVLSHYIAQQFRDRDFTCLTIQTKRQQGTESEALQKGVMQAYVKQVPMDFNAEKERCQMLPLPMYPWDYKFLPVEISIRKWQRDKSYLGKRLLMPQPIWEKRLHLASHSWLLGHKIGKECYLPAAFYIAMLAEADINHVEKMKISNPLVLEELKDYILNFSRQQNGKVETWAAGKMRDDWRLVMQCGKSENCELHREKQEEEGKDFQWERHICGEAVYPILIEKGLCYDGIFSRIEEAWGAEGQAYSRIAGATDEDKEGEYVAILDAMLQTAALAGRQEAGKQEMMVPVYIAEINLYMPWKYWKRKKGSLFAYAEVQREMSDEWTADIFLKDEDGEIMAEFVQVRFKEKKSGDSPDREVYKQIWELIDFSVEIEETGTGNSNIEIYRAGGNWREDVKRFLYLVKEREAGDFPLLVVTENAVKVSPSDAVENYEQAALWGVVRCLKVERPELSIYLLDTDATETAEQLVQCGKLPIGEYELASRKGQLFGSRVWKLEEETAEGRGELQDVKGDTAVITGASGGVAFSYALSLAKMGIKHMMLISRHRAEQLEILLEVLQYYGVETIYQQADVTKREEMQKCWEKLQDKRYGKKVIYHLAGYSRDCLVQDVSPEILEEHMRPKLEGAIQLSEVIRGTEDELVLVGSISAFLGNHGQSCYAAANMVLQSFGEFAGHKMVGFGALDTGMTVQSEDVKKALQMQGIRMMDSREAVYVGENCAEPICYVAKFDWGRLLKIRNIERDKKFVYVAKLQEQENDFWKEYYSAEVEEKEQILIEQLQTIYAQILEVVAEEISPDRNTDTMGIDSLSATFIAGRIQQTLHVDITPDMIEGPFTIRSMAMRMVLEIERMGEIT